MSCAPHTEPSASLLGKSEHHDVGPGLRISLGTDLLGTALEQVGSVRIIRIGHPNVASAGGGDAGVASIGETMVNFMTHEANARILGGSMLDELRDVIGRGVVNADELPVRTGLSTDARDGGGQVGRDAVARHNDREQRPGVDAPPDRLVARAGHASRTVPYMPSTPR